MILNKIISGVGEERINQKLVEENKEGWHAKNISVTYNGLRKEFAVLLEKEVKSN